MKESENLNFILKKRLNSYRTSKGSLIGVPDNLVVEIIKSWEKWTGSTKSFSHSIGIKREQLGFIIRKGKKLFKEGKDKLGPFTPVEIKGSSNSSENTKVPIILNWDKKRKIRFYSVNQLIEFLKKAA